MRCYICDEVLDKPNYNRDHKDFDPCVKCLEVINNVFEDVPEAKPVEDEEISDEDTILLDNID